MSNLNTDPKEWLAEQFAFEYCEECGGDADDHEAIPVAGNWFARCRHPLPENLTTNDEVAAELKRRIARQEAGLSMVE